MGGASRQTESERERERAARKLQQRVCMICVAGCSQCCLLLLHSSSPAAATVQSSSKWSSPLAAVARCPETQHSHQQEQGRGDTSAQSQASNTHTQWQALLFSHHTVLRSAFTRSLVHSLSHSPLRQISPSFHSALPENGPAGAWGSSVVACLNTHKHTHTQQTHGCASTNRTAM